MFDAELTFHFILLPRPINMAGVLAMDFGRPALERNHFRKFTTVTATAARLIAFGQRRAAALSENLRTCWVPPDLVRTVDPNLESFLNCNTPEDYDKARQALS